MLPGKIETAPPVSGLWATALVELTARPWCGMLPPRGQPNRIGGCQLMNSATAGRLTPLSGIVFVALFVLAFALTGDSPQASDSDAEYLAWYGDSGNRTQEIVVFFMIVVGALFFLWFLTSLRERLRAVESGSHGLSTLAFGSGLLSIALLLGAACIGIGPAAVADETDKFQLDPDLARLTSTTSYLLLVSSTMIAAGLVVATSVLAIRNGVLPAWLGWIGLVVAVLTLLAVAWFPILVYLAWILVVSIALVLRPNQQPPPG